jgi:hypothetical protein
VGNQSPNGRHVHHDPASLRLHKGQDSLGHEDQDKKIDFKDPSPFSFGGRQELAVSAQSRVVHKDVNPTPSLYGLSDHSPSIRFLEEISADDQDFARALQGYLLQPVDAPRSKSEVGPSLGKTLGQSGPDARTGPRQNDDLAFEVDHGIPSAILREMNQLSVIYQKGDFRVKKKALIAARDLED